MLSRFLNFLYIIADACNVSEQVMSETNLSNQPKNPETQDKGNSDDSEHPDDSKFSNNENYTMKLSTLLQIFCYFIYQFTILQ